MKAIPPWALFRRCDTLLLYLPIAAPRACARAVRASRRGRWGCARHPRHPGELPASQLENSGWLVHACDGRRAPLARRDARARVPRDSAGSKLV
ncbi:hypothetical protein T492DRAFT_226413 [Pavlovales sp. CCMP2436]|nr:hypothetical protein T492DRAFT_226413 [Pavlovales sp. CCMP2436]